MIFSKLDKILLKNTQMFLQIVLLPLLDHKEAIDTLGFLKLEDLLAFGHWSIDKHTPDFII